MADIPGCPICAKEMAGLSMAILDLPGIHRLNILGVLQEICLISSIMQTQWEH